MSKVFISWYDGKNHDLSNQLFESLKKHGFDIDHSPASPHSGIYDERWAKWYEEGLPKAIAWAEIFIAVITPSCDSSTWMMEEYQEAYSSFMQTGKPVLHYIRYDPGDHQVKYPEYYLQNSFQLSSNPAQTIQNLLNLCL